MRSFCATLYIMLSNKDSCVDTDIDFSYTDSGSGPRPQMKTSEFALALCIALWAQKMRFCVIFMSKYKCGQAQLERIRHR